MSAGNNFLSNRQQIIARTNDNPLHYHAWMSWLLISEFHVQISFPPLKNLKYLFPVKTKSCTCCSGYPSGYPNSVRWITIGLDNGLFSVWYEAITWTNADILLIGPYGTNFSIFSCDQAALRMVFSVCLSVRLSVCPSHLFDYVPIIVSSRNFQELSPRTRVTSMQNVKVRGQRSRLQRSQPNLAVSGL